MLFLSSLAGFFDAEGSIYFHKKGKGGAFEISITNADTEILIRIQRIMAFVGHHSKLETNDQDADRLGYLKEGTISKIRVWRLVDVIGLLKMLHLRHAEKVTKAEIALSYQVARNPEVRAIARRQWAETKKAIVAERNRFIEEARLSLTRIIVEGDR
jgi:hypothetical protein